MPLFVLLLAALAAPASASPRARLSGDVVPIAYDLSVSLDVPASRLTGSETVDVDVRRPVAALVLNARHLTVDGVTIDARAATVATDARIDQIALRDGASIARGRHRVTLRFAGAIDQGAPNGLFTGMAEGAPAVTSEFEPSGAREMFPCFDEPQFRARFTLHVAAPREWTVISNMPLHGQRDDGPDLTWSDFETTPPMPAYMLTLDGETAKQYASPWLTAIIAAADATSDDVQRTEANLRAHPSSDGTVSFEDDFLQNVGDETLARGVLDDAMADPRLAGGNPTSFLFALGTRHPRLAFSYLQTHFRDVEKRLAPTQKTWPRRVERLRA